MDGHLRVDDLVDATRQLVTVESPPTISPPVGGGRGRP